MNNLGNSNTDLIIEHIEKYNGKISCVLHEIVSELVHVDIIVVEPTENEPYFKLFTSGMSDKAMNIPNEVTEKYLELMIILPNTWKINEFKNENWYWPIRLLKKLAIFPHKYNTYIGYGHTIANDEYLDYSDNTKLCSSIILPPVTEEQEFESLKINDEKTIFFYLVAPLYKEETDFKLNNGFASFWNMLIKSEFSFEIDCNRKSIIKE
jgi:hypothetical protein